MKKVKPICGNCRLFDGRKGECQVFVLYEGKKQHIPVDAEDKCFFENTFIATNEDGKKEEFKPEVQQVKIWVEDPITGEKTNKDGVVKIETPEDYWPEQES